MTIFNVGNVDQLNSALASAHGGDTIELAPGQYAGLRLSGLNYSSAVTITSADPTHEAVLTPFYTLNSSNITFSNLEFSGSGSTDPYLFRVYSSTKINYANDYFHGTMGVSPTSEGSVGLAFFSSSAVSVKNSNFTQLQTGLMNDGVSGGVFDANNFYNIRTDGMENAASNNLAITNNTFSDFFPAAGDHPDAIQFWTQGTTVANHDIQVSGNLIVRGAGGQIQGVFMNDEVGSLPYQNVTISNNTVIGSMYNGVCVLHGANVTVANNTVAPFSDMDAYIRMESINGLTEVGNSSYTYVNSGDTSVSQSGNGYIPYVTDSGRALVASWLSAHPGQASDLPPAIAALVDATSGTAATVSANLDALSSNTAVKSIVVTDSAPLSVSAAQVTSDAAALAKVVDADGSAYKLHVTDTAENVSASLAALVSNGHVSAISLTDGAAVTVASSQYTADHVVLGEITGAHMLTLTGYVGQPYSSVTVGLDAKGTWTEKTLNNNDGSHTTWGFVTGLTFADSAHAQSITVTQGSDTFVIDQGFGPETVTGYEPGNDVLSVSHLLFANAAAVFAQASGDGHGGTLITASAGHTLDLVGVSLAQLQSHASDFHFF